MRVFVTGASGYLGWAVVPELLRNGHQVVGLARSDAAAACVVELGATVRRGDVTDHDGLRAAAADADAVIHLAFDHEAVHAGDLAGAAARDIGVVQALADGLGESGKTFVGIGMAPTGNPEVDAVIEANPRAAVAREIVAFNERGIRALLVAVPPVVHSTRDRGGFIPTLIRTARATGVSGYLGEGANHWPAVHALDLARLFGLGLEHAPAGTVQLLGATESGVRVRAIAERIAHHLGVPAQAVAPEHFGPFAFMMGIDLQLPTPDQFGWAAEHPGLLADIDAGHYFAATDE